MQHCVSERLNDVGRGSIASSMLESIHKIYLRTKRASQPFRTKLRERMISDLKVVSLKPPTNSRGNVLLSHVLTPFLLPNHDAIPRTHANYWESWLIGRMFLELGYSV